MSQIERPSEFNRVVTDFPKEVDRCVRRYPLVAAIATVALTILGVFSVLSFSLLGMLSGVILVGSAGLIAKGMMSDPDAFWRELKGSVIALFAKKAIESVVSEATSSVSK